MASLLHPTTHVGASLLWTPGFVSVPFLFLLCRCSPPTLSRAVHCTGARCLLPLSRLLGIPLHLPPGSFFSPAVFPFAHITRCILDGVPPVLAGAPSVSAPVSVVALPLPSFLFLPLLLLCLLFPFTSGETPARTVYIVHNDNIVEAFAALQPCKGPDEVCVATVLNPPKCVASGSPGAILKLSHQQAAMNKLCQREVDTLCRLGKWNKHCFEPWLARKNGTGLACYPREALNFNELSRCFDGCNEAPCPGNPVASTVPRVALPGLAEIARNPFYCSPFQAAGNKYCQTHRGAGYVARQHNVTREWQCFRNDELPAKGWTGCANNCGAFTTCASGSVDADPRLQEDHELEHTIRSTPAPCLTGEECEATPLNPPYCSQTRPNPQPVATSATEIQKELGCVEAANENANNDSRLAAYGPVAHFSTLAWIRSKSGM